MILRKRTDEVVWVKRAERVKRGRAAKVEGLG